MQLHSVSVPAFGEADLSNCENEQIQLAGSIQPHGALLVVRESDRTVVQASENAAEFLELRGEIIGLPVAKLVGDLWDQLAPLLNLPLSPIPAAFRCAIGEGGRAFDGQIHRLPGGGLVVELEVAGPKIDPAAEIKSLLPPITGAASLAELCDVTARGFKELTGYDRVMVYRFDAHGHGEVYSEEKETELESFLGNWYPASDIPQIARKLYLKNRVRMLVNVDYNPVPLTPVLSPLTGQQLDMSLCSLRSMSPIHIQYLKNMGVGATLVVSLVVGGRLWGLIACHHYSSHLLSYEQRTVCELLGEIVSTRVAALESYDRANTILWVRRLEQRMSEAVSRDGDWRSALFDSSHALLSPMAASGAALVFEDQILSVGEVPASTDIQNLVPWLDKQRAEGVVATASISQDAPEHAALTPLASGLLAAPVSSEKGEYLIWFRPERVRTVTWGGNPFKPFTVGSDPTDLSPRRSFAQWHQLVEGTAEPWTEKHLATARLFSTSISDVILQFRSVRALIANDQLAQVIHQVGRSEQLVLVADAEGRILVMNEALTKLMDAHQKPPETLEGLVTRFKNQEAVRARVRNMVEGGQSWLGEASLLVADDQVLPVMVRADRVESGRNRSLGYVVLMTDLSETREIGEARQEFQKHLLADYRHTHAAMDARAQEVFRELLASVIGNAQLAALEIADDVDVGKIPELLDSVRTSADRTVALLEQLIGHASSSADT